MPASCRKLHLESFFQDPSSLRSKKSLDFPSDNDERHQYVEMCDAPFPLSRVAEALDKSEHREVTRAALIAERD